MIFVVLLEIHVSSAQDRTIFEELHDADNEKKGNSHKIYSNANLTWIHILMWKQSHRKSLGQNHKKKVPNNRIIFEQNQKKIGTGRKTKMGDKA